MGGVEEKRLFRALKGRFFPPPFFSIFKFNHFFARRMAEEHVDPSPDAQPAAPADPDQRKSFTEGLYFETDKKRSTNASRLREIIFNMING